MYNKITIAFLFYKIFQVDLKEPEICSFNLSERVFEVSSNPSRILERNFGIHRNIEKMKAEQIYKATMAKLNSRLGSLATRQHQKLLRSG